MRGLTIDDHAVGHWQASETMVCIVGANAFNNEVLSSYIVSHTGFPCYCVDMGDLPKVAHIFGCESIIVYLDLQSMDLTAIDDLQTTSGKCRPGQDLMVICYNVDPNAALESAAIEKGVKGMIYLDQPIDFFPNSARAILDGELWYPRASLEEFILGGCRGEAHLGDTRIKLTRRENEILNMLASGMKNQDMASRLCISPHTVKTHLYNLFKKINVSNRMQAVRWLLEQQS